MKIAFLGDIFLGRKIKEIIDTYGNVYILDEVQSILKNMDYVVANLEAPFTLSRNAYKGKDPHLTFKVDPKYLDFLTQNKINCVTLANNHITDFGESGLLDTLKYLEAHNIKYTGAGINIFEASKPIILENDKIRVLIFSFNSFIPYSTFASKEQFGTLNFKEAHKIIMKYSKHADFIFLTVHWGIDYYLYPIPSQFVKAKFLLRNKKVSGIIGHHPHILQPTFHFSSKLIDLSLGDFIFDEPFPLTRKSKIRVVEIREDKSIIFYDYWIYCDDNFKIRFLEEQEITNLQKELNKIKLRIEKNNYNYLLMQFKWVKYLIKYYLREIYG